MEDTRSSRRLVDDLRTDLSAGTFSSEHLLRGRQLLVAVLRALGDRAEALAELSKYLDELAAQKGPQVARTACRRLADDAFAHRQYAEAIDFYTELQQRWPEEPEAGYGAYRLAECLQRQGNEQDAVAAYQNCIASFPEGESGRVMEQER